MDIFQVAILLMDFMGSGDSAESTSELDNLLLYLGVHLSNVQILNVMKVVQDKDINSLNVSCNCNKMKLSLFGAINSALKSNTET